MHQRRLRASTSLRSADSQPPLPLPPRRSPLSRRSSGGGHRPGGVMGRRRPIRHTPPHLLPPPPPTSPPPTWYRHKSLLLPCPSGLSCPTVGAAVLPEPSLTTTRMGAATRRQRLRVWTTDRDNDDYDVDGNCRRRICPRWSATAVRMMRRSLSPSPSSLGGDGSRDDVDRRLQGDNEVTARRRRSDCKAKTR